MGTSRADGESSAANIALIPVIFRLATIWLSDPEGAREAARTVADECTRLAKITENPYLWNEAARLVREIFEKEASWQQLNDRGNEYAAKNETVLHIICYAGAMIHVRPRDALRLQLTILPALEFQLKHYGIFRRIVVPFVLKYWEDRLEKSAYYFTAPDVLRERLRNLPSGFPEDRLRRILREMAFPLGLTFFDAERKWLQIA